MIYNYLLVALVTCLSLCMAAPLQSTIHSSSSCIMQLMSSDEGRGIEARHNPIDSRIPHAEANPIADKKSVLVSY